MDDKPPPFEAGNRAEEGSLSYALSLLQAALDSTEDGILVISREGRVSFYNRRMAEIWQLPRPLLDKGDDLSLLEYVLSKLKDPDAFLSRVKQLYAAPQQESFDTIELADGRMLERYSRPQYLGSDIVGRVWSFRDVTASRQIQYRLRESEERFSEIFEYAPIGMIVTALDGRFIQFNQAFCEIIGYQRKELQKLSYGDITYPEDITSSEAHVQSLLDGSVRSFQMQTRYLHKNGLLIWARISCSLHMNAKGAPQYFITQIEDITEYKKANERIRMMANVFEHSMEAILITDASNLIIDVNPSFTRLTGYSLHDAIGKNPKMLSSGAQTPEFYKGMWQCLLNEGYWQGEILDKRKDGSTYPKWLTITAVRNEKNETTNYIGSFTDISQLRRA
ncbi:MAG: PAS domain S-box protein [Gallionella sp.]